MGMKMRERMVRITVRLRFWKLFISCMNLYISVLLGSGCSHSFRGTLRESMVKCDEKKSTQNVEKKESMRETKEEDYLSPMNCC